MDDYVKKIYDMMYSPLVTPYNLLENAKMDNYGYVKYCKSENGLVAEMECSIPNEGIKVFYYYFDSNDFLRCIYVECDGVKQRVFDREDAVQEAKNEYVEAKIISEIAI